MIEIKISAESPQALEQLIGNLFPGLFGGRDRDRTCYPLNANQLSESIPQHSESNGNSVQQAESPRKKGRPKKEKSAQVVDSADGQKNIATTPENGNENQQVATENSEVATPAPAAAAISRDDVYKALKSVHDSKGIEVAQQCVSEVGGSRISDVKEEDFARFVEICAKARGDV